MAGFADALSRETEVKVTVARRSGGTLELLPMYGLKTVWFRDFERAGSLELSVGNERTKAVPRVLRNAASVEEVKGRFGKKYGAGEVRKYYPTSEVALKVEL
ncbi:MAG: hypothetical protein HY247_05040 [archaeon]|nr:MAG: hypothetical protein HY247_05040 [archaeon]